jgi:hypothetical protein
MLLRGWRITNCRIQLQNNWFKISRGHSSYKEVKRVKRRLRKGIKTQKLLIWRMGLYLPKN